MGNPKEIKFVISDLHLGPGWGEMEFFLDDKIFKHFVKMLIDRYAATETKVTLILNGDTFDPLSVSYKNKFVVVTTERVDLYKLKKIVNGHPYIFDILRKFICVKNFEIVFVIGNHDLFLHWSLAQEFLIQTLGEENAARISFVTDILENGIYIAHGASEYHNRPSVPPIVKEKHLTSVFRRGGWQKLLDGDFTFSRDVLNVPLGHYMINVLQNPLKKYNSLIGHMHTHGFVWLNALFGIFRKTWYRRHRLFAAIAVLTGIWIILRYWWYTGDWGVFMKMLRVLWWTITGALEGQLPAEEARRLLEREDVDVVIFGHEHKVRYEVLRINKKNQLYVNSGTWQSIREVVKKPIILKWKRFQNLEKIIKRTKRFFVYLFCPEIVDVTDYPVVIITLENDERVIKLMRFNDESRGLKELV